MRLEIRGVEYEFCQWEIQNPPFIMGKVHPILQTLPLIISIERTNMEKKKKKI